VTSSSKAAPFSWYYILPGIVATLGVILLGAAGGPDEGGGYFVDEGEQCRAKCSLFIAVRRLRAAAAAARGGGGGGGGGGGADTWRVLAWG
jgi:hypothetical protein